MKKNTLVILFAFLIVCTVKAHSQDFMYDSYVGKDLIVKKKPPYNKLFSEIAPFYKTPKENQNPSNIVYPVVDSNGEAYSSFRDSLVGLKLHCVAITNDGYSTTFLQLKNDKIGIVYFDAVYAPTEFATDEEIQKEKQAEINAKKERESPKSDFAKQVADYKNIIANPCLQVDKYYDDIHYVYKYSTGYIKPEYPKTDAEYSTPIQLYDITFYKEKSKSGITYYMSISGESSTPLAIEKGIIIVLKNKKRINKPDALVRTRVNETGDNGEAYIRSSFIKLSSQDIESLKASPIDEFELYDTQVSEQDYKVLHQMFLCLINK